MWFAFLFESSYDSRQTLRRKAALSLLGEKTSVVSTSVQAQVSAGARRVRLSKALSGKDSERQVGVQGNALTKHSDTDPEQLWSEDSILPMG